MTPLDRYGHELIYALERERIDRRNERITALRPSELQPPGVEMEGHRGVAARVRGMFRRWLAAAGERPAADPASHPTLREEKNSAQRPGTT